MSKGYIPQNTICAYCHRDVFETDALWYEGLPYHEAHFKLYLVNEIRQYEKKKGLGTLTMSEAVRYQDFLEMYEIERRSAPLTKLSKHFNPEQPRFFGNSFLAKQSIEMKQLKAAEYHKKLTGSEDEKTTTISTGKHSKNMTLIGTQKQPFFTQH